MQPQSFIGILTKIFDTIGMIAYFSLHFICEKIIII